MTLMADNLQLQSHFIRTKSGPGAGQDPLCGYHTVLDICRNDCRLDRLYICRYALVGLAMEPGRRAVNLSVLVLHD